MCLALGIGGPDGNAIVGIQKIFSVVRVVRSLRRENDVEVAVCIGQDRSLQDDVTTEIVAVRAAVRGPLDAVPHLAARHRESGIAAQLAALPDHVAVADGFCQRLERHGEVGPFVFLHPDTRAGDIFGIDDIHAILASFGKLERTGGGTEGVGHEQKRIGHLFVGLVTDRHAHLFVGKHFAGCLPGFVAKQFEMNRIGRLVQRPVGKDPALLIPEHLLFPQGTIIRLVKPADQRRIDVPAGFNPQLVVVLAVTDGLARPHLLEPFAAERIGQMRLQRKDGVLVVLVEILVQADFPFFERFARSQVGGIDFGLAAADAHRPGHVAHTNLVIAHFTPDVRCGFASLHGGEADDINARLRESDIRFDCLGDMVIADEPIDGLRGNQRGVLAQGRLVGIAVSG